MFYQTILHNHSLLATRWDADAHYTLQWDVVSILNLSKSAVPGTCSGPVHNRMIYFSQRRQDRF